MDVASCHCGADAFAGFDVCHNHVPRTALICEVIRLRVHLHDARTALDDERARRGRADDPTANRRETTILERM